VNSGNTEKVNKKVWGDYIETLKALKKRKQESRNILDSYSRIVEQDKLNDVYSHEIKFCMVLQGQAKHIIQLMKRYQLFIRRRFKSQVQHICS
jgi:hypothetical protein